MDMNLTKLRRVAGMTQFTLSKRARVPRSKIADVEAGRAEFNQCELDRIINALASSLTASLVELNHLLTTCRELDR
jgi:predicted transcriptional regulator